MSDRGREEAGASPATAHAIALSDAIRGALSFQSYDARAAITGVEIRPLRKHRAENGWFVELARLRGGALQDESDWELRQLSASYAAPGRINAFHIHPRLPQSEIWTVLQGQLLVWLVDCRKESPTEGVRQPVLLQGEEPARLFIPPGVAHGYRAGPQGALLVYAMDQQFDPQNPNEGRLPWDHFGEILWSEDRG